MQFPKEKIYRSEEYKAYVRKLPCVICGGDAEPHHEVSGGMAIKGSDLFCIPLCRIDHNYYNTIGVESFWKEANKDRWQVIAETLAKVWEMKEKEFCE